MFIVVDQPEVAPWGARLAHSKQPFQRITRLCCYTWCPVSQVHSRSLTNSHVDGRRQCAQSGLKDEMCICSTFPKVIHDHVSEKSLSLSLLVECKRDNARELLCSLAASCRAYRFITLPNRQLSFQNLCEMTCYSGQLVCKSTFTPEVCIFVELIFKKTCCLTLSSYISQFFSRFFQAFPRSKVLWH
jgi:hypothetical protein